MKIKIVNYQDGEARFVLEEFPKKTICIPLIDKDTAVDVIDILKIRADALLPDNTEQKFIDLGLKDLEGTEI